MEQVKECLSEGWDVDAVEGDTTALAAIAGSGHLEIVALLIDAGADANWRSDSGVTPLSVAGYFGHAQTVDVLLKSGADPNAAGAIHVAAQNGYTGIVRQLLSSEADPDLRVGPNGQTALHYAVLGNNSTVVETLLAGGASPLIRSKNGKIPIQMTVKPDHQGVAGHLIQRMISKDD